MSEAVIENGCRIDDCLRQDRLPHIWCSGCGLGTAVQAFLSALLKSGRSLDLTAIVSGIGCTGRVAGYVKLDSFHTTHGRAIPFATGLKLAKPELQVVVFSGDGDLFSIGGNHFIHAARRNIDLMVVCVNNFNFGMTGGQVASTTPLNARTSTSPYGNFEHPFNIPSLAEVAGATYVARWTTIQVRQMERAFSEALAKPGFRLMEIIAPCPTAYGRMNRLPMGLDMMKFYRDNSVIKNGADPREVGISLGGKIVVGKFVDIERPTFSDLQREVYRKTIGDRT